MCGQDRERKNNKDTERERERDQKKLKYSVVSHSIKCPGKSQGLEGIQRAKNFIFMCQDHP